MDELDKKIIELLKEDGQRSNKEIGNQIHLTGQAVGQRVQHLKDQGTIEGYTIKIKNKTKQFIRLFMEGNQFSLVEKEVMDYSEVDEFYKVSGHACYVVVAHFNQENLNEFIESLSKWARCSVDTVVSDKLK